MRGTQYYGCMTNWAKEMVKKYDCIEMRKIKEVTSKDWRIAFCAAGGHVHHVRDAGCTVAMPSGIQAVSCCSLFDKTFDVGTMEKTLFITTGVRLGNGEAI